MKKNVLTLSITAALVGLGFAGGAQAIGLANNGPTPIPPGLATNLVTAADGVGHFLYVPYYNTQGANNTMISIVNTDTVNGKAVKVRFRGAANSDDVFDFQVFLSPADVWTASVYKDVNGLAHMRTTDLSCTKPDKGPADGSQAGTLNGEAFHTVRLDPNRTGDKLANETREGYVEIFNMADIPPTLSGAGPIVNGAPTTLSGTNPLFTAVKHVLGSPNGAPPCRTTPSTAAWTALESDPLGTPEANAKGLYAPSTGLFSNWIILNATDAGAWSGAATAIVATTSLGVATTGAITYFPQTNEGLSAANATTARVSLFTADPVLRANPSMAATYDLPDFSIPYTNVSDPVYQVGQLSAAIATRNIINEYLTPSSINATTDWVLSMPTRRYSVAYDYLAPVGTVVGTAPATTSVGTVRYTALTPAYFDATNTTVVDRQVCVLGTTLSPFDQEETSPTTPGAGVIISPAVPGKPSTFKVCGEASVLAFNTGESASSTGLITTPSGTFKATVARSAVDLPYSAGWANLATPGIANNGLPVLGYEAIRATAGLAAFGATLPHRTNLIQK